MTIPDYVIKDLFTDHGLLFVDNTQIPPKMMKKGWKSETWQKVCGDGSIAVVHVIYGPNEDGEIVCMREEKMAIYLSSHQSQDGNTENRITKVFVDQESSQNKNPCTELVKTLTK